MPCEYSDSFGLSACNKYGSLRGIGNSAGSEFERIGFFITGLVIVCVAGFYIYRRMNGAKYEGVLLDYDSYSFEESEFT
eukprot:13363707-Ditylum_brightwellii.AAC.1